jgi:hypothetical protein
MTGVRNVFSYYLTTKFIKSNCLALAKGDQTLVANVNDIRKCDKIKIILKKR